MLLLPIREHVVEGKRLGRHIRHDDRSLQYAITPAKQTKSVEWKRVIPILNQGKLGSCTGNATVGLLGTEVNYDDLSATQQKVLGEELAIQFYSQGTKEDCYPGDYPPVDTGCDGLTLCKVAVENGYAPGYLHPIGADGLKAALQDDPAMVGVSWFSGMDQPDSNGLVHATGFVRGGHQFEVTGWDEENQLFKCANSWGDGWGKNGYFFISYADMTNLLSQRGDAQVLLPLSDDKPAPQGK